MSTRKLLLFGLTPRPVAATSVAGILLACLLGGCATERLEPAAPAGVNLAGEWNFNPNLSDDADKLGTDTDKTQQRPSGSHRGHGGGRGGTGMPPMGSPGSGSNYLPMALSAQGIEQPLPPTTSDSSAGGHSQSRGVSINRVLRAPVHMTITQNGASLTITTNMADGSHTADEYTAGTKATIPVGNDQTAEREAGWRGPVFVVTMTVKKGGWREDDFALDEDGRLIMTTQTKGGKLGSVAIKRVYDRARGAQSS